MVIIMVEDGPGESTVEVDRQGRMVLPSRFRERLGLKKGGRVSVRLEDSSKVVIEPKVDEGVEERARSWLGMALSTRVEAFSAKADKGKSKAGWSKWMSSDYARRKLGLPPRH
jgi:AbrB family looped-hinge helix DNA binding protein